MFVIKPKKAIISITLILVIIATSVCFLGLNKSSLEGVDATKLKFVIDAGHGGVDVGVSGIKTSVKESDINLKIAKKLDKIIVDSGYLSVLTRTSDAGLYGTATNNRKKKDMLKRKEIIQKAKPNFVISIHMNYFSTLDRKGAQVFYNSKNTESVKLANSIQNNFNEMVEGSRDFSALSGDYYILNCTEYTSVICECGFLSNPEEESLLLTDEYQDLVAYTIFKGVIEYLAS